MATKLYRFNPELSHLAGETKLPKQQRQILAAIAANCVETGMTGKEIIALAVRDHGLETRQRYDVLYAWYARSNENLGVFIDKPEPVIAPVKVKKIKVTAVAA